MIIDNNRKTKPNPEGVEYDETKISPLQGSKLIAQ